MGLSGSVSYGGHCSFLLGPGVHKVIVCALQESVSPVLCKFWQPCDVGLMVTSSKRAYAAPRSATPRPLLALPSLGDAQTWFWPSLCGLGLSFVPFPGLSSLGHQVLGERTVPGASCILLTSPVLPPGVLGVLQERYLKCAVCLLWRGEPRLQPSWQMSTIQDFRKTWLAAGSL